MRESTGRSLRIEELKSLIKITGESGQYIDEKKMVAELSLKWNVAIRKVQEYLNLLLTTEFCVRTDQGILTKEMAEAQLIIDKAQAHEEEEGGKKE